ncbi:MAG TPA: hypothetical protein VHW64_18305 [Nocardioides sp.]|jgi:hypothetical protein|uniref:hypothetical protein n=1 Tax=Nocardioides sp. TaxID=35761 RepID=UPI002E30740E|nr:hypothetical protein [Nocardioides sp.]HEX3932654.1 hypothetical protein [Nocardioides sp.]
MRIKTGIGSVALTMTASLLAACGGGGGGSSHSAGSYCDELKTDKTYFESFSGSNPDLSKLGDVFTRMHQLAGDAPSNVAADWKTLDGAITTLESALKAANIKPSDLAAMQNGQMPQGANLQKLQALAPKLEALSSSGVSSAADRISADAKKSCGIDLSSS